MRLLNFSDSVPENVLDEIKNLKQYPSIEIYDVHMNLRPSQLLAPQIKNVVRHIPPKLWNEDFLINLPPDVFVASIILAEVSGRSLFMPIIFQYKHGILQVYDLQLIRQAARFEASRMHVPE